MAFESFALILAMLALGLLFRRLRSFPDNAPEVINKVVLTVCLPASILIYAPRLHLMSAAAAGYWAREDFFTLAACDLVAPEQEVRLRAVATADVSGRVVVGVPDPNDLSPTRAVTTRSTRPCRRSARKWWLSSSRRPACRRNA